LACLVRELQQSLQREDGVFVATADGVTGIRRAHEQLVRAAFKAADGNKKRAARELGMAVRSLRYWLERYEIR